MRERGGKFMEERNGDDDSEDSSWCIWHSKS